jgi:hypothetical protein
MRWYDLPSQSTTSSSSPVRNVRHKILLRSCSNTSIQNMGSVARDRSTTYAFSVSSNNPPIVLVTERMLETTGFFD